MTRSMRRTWGRLVGLSLHVIAGIALSGCGGGGGAGSSNGGGLTITNYVKFSNGQNAAVVIGEPDFTTSTLGRGATQNLFGKGLQLAGSPIPSSEPDVINGVLYASDWFNNRILGFNTIPATNAANADFVLGAANFTTGGTINGPTVAANTNNVLFVDELVANQIDVYTPIPTAATSSPAASSPQTVSFTLTASTVGNLNLPEAISTGGGKLVVADSGNNRVLIWNSIPTSDTPPDLVLGQSDFSSISANAGGGTPTSSSMSDPSGVWTDGTRLVVLDTKNNRVLIWNTFPTTNNQPADLVLGQSDFTSSSPNQGLSASTAATIYQPYTGVFASGNQLFVCDTTNNRVLIWNTWPTKNDQVADVVLGQPNFTTSAYGLSQNRMDGPSGVYLSGKQLIVGSEVTTRYLVFNGQ